MNKRIVKIISMVFILVAVFLGYLGVSNTQKARDDLFIVEDTLRVEVTDSGNDLIFHIYNLTEETINDLVINIGIKDDENYNTETDEIVVEIDKFAYKKDTSFDISFNKVTFRPGKTSKNGAIVTIGSNVEEIENYDYVHKIMIGTEEKEFNNGEKIETSYYIVAGVMLVIAVILLVYSRNLPEYIKKPEPFVYVEEEKEEWEKEPVVYEEKKEESVYVDNEHTKMLEEDKKKYIDSMEVIDMDKDEL